MNILKNKAIIQLILCNLIFAAALGCQIQLSGDEIDPSGGGATNGGTEPITTTFGHLVTSLNISNPDIAVEGTNIYISYTEITNNQHHLKMAKSIDNGVTWSLQTIDASNLGNPGRTPSPSIAVNGSNIYISYSDFQTAVCSGATSGHGLLKVATSNNAGSTWSLQTLHPGLVHPLATGSNCYPMGDSSQLVVVNSSLFISHRNENGEVLFSKSTDNGSTWSFQSLIYCGANATSLAVDGSNVYISVSCAPGTGMLEWRLAKSVNSGTSWSFQTINSQIDTISSMRPSLIVNGSSVYYVYTPISASNTSYDLGLAVSSNAGSTWILWKVVSNLTGYPSLAFQGSQITIAYSQDTPEGGSSVKLAQSSDNGANWSINTIHTLTYKFFSAPNVSIALSGSSVHLAYTTGDLFEDAGLWYAKQ